jgi:RND superfamily putative drug exporter
MPIPTNSDSEAATQKRDAGGQGENSVQGDNGDNSPQRRRVAGGLSAQDLLRREGRL